MKKKKLGRRPIPENQRRVKVSFRVSPETARRIKRDTSAYGESAGRFVDHLMETHSCFR